MPPEMEPGDAPPAAAEPEAGLSGLFDGNDETDEDASSSSSFWSKAITIPSAAADRQPHLLTLHVTLAGDDGSAPASLFAFSVWNGAVLLAEHLHHDPSLIRGKTTIEFGAAGALPSLVALALGSRFSVMTDYPSEPLLEAMRRSLADPRNAPVLGRGLHKQQHEEGEPRAAVLGHLWGSDPAPLLAALPASGDGVGSGYDLAIVGECLWLHREHGNLLRSIYRCLRPGGQALVSFAHHVPGCEAKDLDFFRLAAEARCYGDKDNDEDSSVTSSSSPAVGQERGGGRHRGRFEVAQLASRRMAHMHSAGRTVEQFMYMLTKREME